MNVHDKQFVVTGSNGFIGRAVTLELQRRGHVVFSLGIGAGQSGRRYDARVALDASADELTAVFAALRPDGVLHLAATMDTGCPATLFALNAGFSATLIEAVRRLGGGCPLLLVGSAAEYGPLPTGMVPLDESACTAPVSLYGISKLAQTLTGLSAAGCGQAVTIARVFNVVGPGMPGRLSLPSFARRLAAIAGLSGSQPRLAAGNLNAVRDFISVYEAAAALVDLVTSQTACGQVVNVCGGRAYRMGDVLDRMIELTGMDVVVDASLPLAGTTDIAYGDPALFLELTGRTLSPLNNADLAEVLQEVGCSTRIVSELEEVPTVSPVGQPESMIVEGCSG